MVLLTILRRLFRDTRWSLVCSLLAFFGLAILWNWGVSINQFPPPETDAPAAAQNPPDNTPAQPENSVPPENTTDRGAVNSGVGEAATSPTEPPRPRRGRRRGMGLYIGLGVPAERMLDPDNPPTLLMQVSLANHPLIFLTLLGWAIARASAAVAGEIERGTLDLTLARPVRRSTFLAAQVLNAGLVFLGLGLALVAGHLAAPWFFPLKAPPGPAAYGPALLMLMGLPLAVFGYTLVVSALDLSRARAGILGLGVTLAGIAGIIFSRQLEGYEWMARLSVFEYYAPVGIVQNWGSERSRDLAVLYGVFALGLVLSFVGFLRRDLPSSGG